MKDITTMTIGELRAEALTCAERFKLLAETGQDAKSVARRYEAIQMEIAKRGDVE